MRVECCYEHYIMYVTFKQFLNQNGYKLGYLKESNAAAYFVDSVSFELNTFLTR